MPRLKRFMAAALLRVYEEARVPRTRRAVFFTLIAVSVLIRLPFFFTSTDGYMRDAAITFHDEAMLMQQGRDVLRGHWPYITHWDNAAPLQWLVYAAIMLVTGCKLTLYRLLGAIYIGITSYVLFRVLAERGKMQCAWWSAIFYIVFGSTLQAGQSFTLEHLLGLPFAVILHDVLNHRYCAAGRRRDARVLMAFAFCVWLTPSFLCMAPGIALLYPGLRVPPFPLERRNGRIARALRAAWPLLIRMVWLLIVAAAGYAFFWLLYLLRGEGDFFLRSVFRASDYIAGPRAPLSYHFFRQYFVKMVHSDQWIMPLLLLCYVLRAGAMLLRGRAKEDVLLYKMLLLAVCAFYMIYCRGNNSSYFLFYLLQALPMCALMMGYAFHFNLADLRWFGITVSVLGLLNTTDDVRSHYAGMVKYAAGDKAQQDNFYGDRLYRTLEVMSTFPLEGETLIVCGEDDMLYMLSGMENPRYMFFPFYSYNTGLHAILNRNFPTLRAVVLAKNPLYITGREGDPLTNRGFAELGDLLTQRYVQVGSIEGTVIYVRKDRLRNIFAN